MRRPVVVFPLPHENLEGHPNLRGCQTHSRGRVHSVDHVFDEALEFTVPQGHRLGRAMQRGVTGNPDGTNAHRFEVGRADAGESRDTLLTGRASG
jgi:hypothetical protein